MPFGGRPNRLQEPSVLAHRDQQHHGSRRIVGILRDHLLQRNNLPLRRQQPDTPQGVELSAIEGKLIEDLAKVSLRQI